MRQRRIVRYQLSRADWTIRHLLFLSFGGLWRVLSEGSQRCAALLAEGHRRPHAEYNVAEVPHVLKIVCGSSAVGGRAAAAPT